MGIDISRPWGITNQLVHGKSGENAKEETHTGILAEQEMESQPLADTPPSFDAHDLTRVEEFTPAENGVKNTSSVVEDMKPMSQDVFASSSPTYFHTANQTPEINVSLPTLESLDEEYGKRHKGEIPQLQFSISELVQVAITTLSKTSCVNIELISCGAFNKVYVFIFCDGTDVIARLPHAEGKY